jgi:hypothetical protein
LLGALTAVLQVAASAEGAAAGGAGEGPLLAEQDTPLSAQARGAGYGARRSTLALYHALACALVHPAGHYAPRAAQARGRVLQPLDVHYGLVEHLEAEARDGGWCELRLVWSVPDRSPIKDWRFSFKFR